MKSPTEQILVLGAVFEKANPEAYFDFATSTENLRKLPGYLAIRKFSDPPQTPEKPFDQELTVNS